MILYIYSLLTKRFPHNLEKKLIKASQKTGKIIYLSKSLNFNFFVTFKILSSFQEGSYRKVTSQLFVDICFAYLSRNVFRNLSFYFCLNVHKLGDSFKSIWRKIYATLFCFYVILSSGYSGLNCELIRRKYGFSIDLKISFMSSGNKSILTLKISVTNFFKFWYFAVFDIRIELFGQNSFEWIAIC